jgi:hypothetical protein
MGGAACGNRQLAYRQLTIRFGARNLTLVINQGFNPYRMTIDLMRFFVPEIEKRSN